MAWITDADGWQSRKLRGGGTDYRMLASDTGRPQFSGAAKRFAWVYVAADGTVVSKSAAGFSRRHATVEDAKAAVAPRAATSLDTPWNDDADGCAPSILAALVEAEAFIAGFEGDDMQEPSVDPMLARIRAAITLAGG
jgi:hypothetical protein